MFDNAKRLQYVDAARGWAFLGVLAVHVGPYAPSSVIPIPQLCTSGNYGVQLFFIASALTLFFSFESAYNSTSRPIIVFLMRRFFRIAPLFYLGAFFYVFLHGTGPSGSAPYGIDVHHIALTYLFLHGWWPDTINSVVPGGWSIAVEMNFYLLLPLLFSVLTTLWRTWLAVVVALPLSIAVSIYTQQLVMSWLSPPMADTGFTYYWLPRQFPIFLLGIALYHATRIKAFDRFSHYAVLIGLVGLSVVMAAGSHIPLGYLTHATFFSIVLWGLSRKPWRLLVNPVVCLIGTLSFSAYITHFAILDAISRLDLNTTVDPNSAVSVVRYVVFYGTGLVLTLMVSWVTYHLIESPGQRFGRYLIGRLGLLSLRPRMGGS